MSFVRILSRHAGHAARIKSHVLSEIHPWLLAKLKFARPVACFGPLIDLATVDISKVAPVCIMLRVSYIV